MIKVYILSIMVMLTTITFYELTDIEPLNTEQRDELKALDLSIFRRLEKDYDYVGELLGVKRFDLKIDEIESFKDVETVEEAQEKINNILDEFGIENN